MSPRSNRPTTLNIGVDVGKRRLAIGWPGLPLSDAIDLGKKPGLRSVELRQIQQWVQLNVPKSAQLWVEVPYVSSGAARNPTTSLDMAETVSALRTALPWGNEFIMVSPNTWKAKLLGNHRASKDQIASWLLENHPQLYMETAGQEDRVDAMCIGLYGAARVRGEIEAPVPKKRKKRRKASA